MEVVKYLASKGQYLTDVLKSSLFLWSVVLTVIGTSPGTCMSLPVPESSSLSYPRMTTPHLLELEAEQKQAYIEDEGCRITVWYVSEAMDSAWNIYYMPVWSDTCMFQLKSWKFLKEHLLKSMGPMFFQVHKVPVYVLYSTFLNYLFMWVWATGKSSFWYFFFRWGSSYRMTVKRWQAKMPVFARALQTAFHLYIRVSDRI